MASSMAKKSHSAFTDLRERKHLHAILDTVPDAMIAIDTDGRIMSFSAGAEKMFGYEETALIGSNVDCLMPSPDRENHDGYIRRYLETQEPHVIGIGRTAEALRSDGSQFPIELSVSEVQIDGRRVFVGFIRDLTRHKETERRLHALQSDLAHASRISSMGSLATSIAHELNQPLAAIANYVEGAKQLIDEAETGRLEEVRTAIDECASEALRAGAIVRKLRDFIGRGDVERHAASFARLLNDAIALALIDGQGHDVTVETRLDPEADLVLVEPIHVQQVLVNLLRNAVEAMQGGRDKRVEISTSKRDDGFIEVTIADSGPGLDRHIAERLFQPFVSTKESGMGLGLSICHTIVNSHGGKIWAEPSALGGTAFHFTLLDASSHDD